MARVRSTAIEEIAADIAGGPSAPLYLVVGDRVLAEPAAIRIGETLADKAGCKVEVHRRPTGLAALLSDLKTFSLFDSAKVIVAIDSAVLADTAAAAQLVDEALEVCPINLAEDEELSERQRRSASLLLQTLRLFQIESAAGSASSA